MACDVCDGKENVIFENDEIIIALPKTPSISGHLQLFPKKHVTIMEQLDNSQADALIMAANNLSVILFEALNVHGTNIVVENGAAAGQTLPHFSMHVIPRRNDDGLKLDWDMKQASPEALESMQRIISEGLDLSEPQPKLIVQSEPPPEKPKQDKKTNYWLKSLERIP